MHDTPVAVSLQEFFATFRNRMEERILKTKLGSIDLEEKRVLRRLRSETRLLKIKQEQRLGNLTACRRNEANGSHTNKGRSPSPQSPGLPCQWDFTKLQFKCDKRPHSKSIYSVELPGSASDATSLSTNDEFTQPSRRLPKLPSVENAKLTEPLSPTSKNNYQFPGNGKPTWTPTSSLENWAKSVEKASLQSDAEDTQSALGSNSDNPTLFITEAKPREKTSSTRVRRQTWNGKSPPKLQILQPVTQRERSYSDDKDEPRKNEETSSLDLTLTTSKDLSPVHTDYRTGENLSLNKLKGSSRMIFPMAEDILRRNDLTVPNFPIKKSSSVKSLTPLGSLPPVFESGNYNSASLNREEDVDVTGGAEVNFPLPDGGKGSQQSPLCPPGEVCLLPQRRSRTLCRQENIMGDDSGTTAPTSHTEGTVQSQRPGENRPGVARKVSVQCRSGQATNQEIDALKNTSLKKGKLAVRSRSLSSSLGQSYREETGKDIPKKKEKGKESVKTKRKQALDNDTETNENEATMPIDKSKWLRALRKVFNMNMFLNGMVALQKQREHDRLAIEKKKADLERLYQELQHCRYLRLPSKEDDEQSDCVSWVFDKK